MTYSPSERPTRPTPEEMQEMRELDEVALRLHQEIDRLREADEETETDTDDDTRRPLTGRERSAAWRARQKAERGTDFTRDESAARRARRLHR